MSTKTELRLSRARTTKRPEPVVVWRGRGSIAASSINFEAEAELYGLHRVSGDLRAPETTYWRTPEKCPFCCSLMQTSVIDEMQFEVTQSDSKCTFCGYDQRLVETLHYTAIDMRRELGAGNINDQFLHRPILKIFDINDPQLAFAELGKWLSEHSERMYDLTPRRFEELVDDVFKNMGYRTRLTQASKDGGVDIYLLDKEGQQAIVQVKRYRADRKIGVELIDQVRGLKLRPVHRNVHKAFVVTSSSFTRGAIERAGEAPVITTFEMELIDCDDLLHELEAYNVNLPRLSVHIKKALKL